MVYSVVAVKIDGDKIVNKFQNRNDAESMYYNYMCIISRSPILNIYSRVSLYEGNRVMEREYFNN